MLSLPKSAEPLLSRFSIAFTGRTFQRVLVLAVGTLLCMGRHTVAAALRAVGALAAGHYSDYHRVLSRARWSLWPLAKVLSAMVLELVPRGEPVVCPVDDTSPQHKGKQVYGKGRHHDACRSTHNHVVWVWGHKWVVLAALVKFPFASRRWALPLLVALYRPQELNEQEGRRHKTPIDLARQLVAVLVHWFPGRRFILLGDGGYASHDLARFCHRHRRHLTLVSLLHSRANLFGLPTEAKAKTTSKGKGKGGRPRIKGDKLPAPADVVAQTSKRRRTTVSWYGEGSRRVEFVTGSGHWYKGGRGLVPLRWVFVHDLTGTHRDHYFYSTDGSLSPTKIIGLYTGRWSIEVTFQESRLHLGIHTPRNWARQSVLRTVPLLLGLFSLASLIYHRHTRGKGTKLRATAWYAKAEPTFVDAMATVRRLLWCQTVLKQWTGHEAFQNLPVKLRTTLLEHLCRAA